MVPSALLSHQSVPFRGLLLWSALWGPFSLPSGSPELAGDFARCTSVPHHCFLSAGGVSTGRWRVRLWLAVTEGHRDRAGQSVRSVAIHRVSAMIYHITSLEQWVAFRFSTLLVTECLQFSSCSQGIRDPERMNTVSSGKAALVPGPPTPEEVQRPPYYILGGKLKAEPGDICHRSNSRQSGVSWAPSRSERPEQSCLWPFT